MSNSEGKHSNYLRFVWMFKNLSRETAIDVFQKISQVDNISAYLQSEEIKPKIENLRKEHVLDKTAYDHVQNGVTNIDLNTFITLMINLFSKDQLEPPKKGWGHQPRPNDKSLGADLLRLRYHRNRVAHSVRAELEEDEFENKWDEVKEIIIRIYTNIKPGSVSKLKMTFEDYKTKPLETSEKHECTKLIKEWKARMLQDQTKVRLLITVASIYIEICCKYLH
jgi:hypothetical protein